MDQTNIMQISITKFQIDYRWMWGVNKWVRRLVGFCQPFPIWWRFYHAPSSALIQICENGSNSWVKTETIAYLPSAVQTEEALPERKGLSLRKKKASNFRSRPRSCFSRLRGRWRPGLINWLHRWYFGKKLVSSFSLKTTTVHSLKFNLLVSQKRDELGRVLNAMNIAKAKAQSEAHKKH